FGLMIPLIIIAEKRRQMKNVVLIAAALILLALLLMIQAVSLWHWAVLMLLYFLGFNLMEASLPSWLSKIAPAGSKGSAMGIYSSMQFLGAFAGGTIGGWVLSHWGASSVFAIFAAAVLLWGLLMLMTPA
ncbi:MFS transporter, partial [Wenyingzhuangia sp. 1_MG-2023]|nr:MFS transporter [Wenyingzhuangia sp. 1_MG-2023]